MLLEKMSKVKDGDDLEMDVIEAFHYGCFYGNEWVVRLCLEHISDVDRAGTYSETGLHKAALQGRKWVAAALLEFDADLDKRDVRTPLSTLPFEEITTRLSDCS
jgi:ankyrin repeat protein